MSEVGGETPVATMRLRDRLQAQSLRVPFKIKLAVVWVVIFTVLAVLFDAMQFDVPFMRQWTPFLLKGVPTTLLVSVLAILLALPLGLLGALGRLSKNPIAHGVASFYISFIRGTPLIIQIFFVYLALPQLSLSLPSSIGKFLILPALVSGVLALGVNYGAYTSEIFRAGIQSVSHGQREAAEALGMTYRQTMRRVVLPQAVRVIIPPTGNEFIAMLKDSALVSFVGVQELFWRAENIGQRFFKGFETLVVAAVIYWILTSIFSFFQARLETRMSKGYVREVAHGH
ncbi:MAG: amino acid ABC transporter permease [Actinomycetota bacterium]